MADKLVCNNQKEVLKALCDKREFTLSTTLTELYLQWNKIGSSGAKSLSDSLKENSTLTKLYFFNSNIGDEGAKSLSDSLKVNTTLTEIYLGGNNIGNEGATLLSDSLKVNTTLTALNLGGNNIDSSGAKSLSDSLKVNTTLTILYLDNNIIGDSGAKSLSDSLKGNTTLTGLGLYNDDIGDEGAKSLSDSLKVNTSLTLLGLYKNNIGDEGAKALLEAMKLNYSITNQSNNKDYVQYFIGDNKCSAGIKKQLEDEIVLNQDPQKVVVKKRRKQLHENSPILLIEKKIGEIFSQFDIGHEFFEKTVQCFLTGYSVDFLFKDFIPRNYHNSVQKEIESLNQKISEFYSKKGKALVSSFLRNWKISEQGIPENIYSSLLHSDTNQVFQILEGYTVPHKHMQLKTEIENLQKEFVNVIPGFIIDKEKTTLGGNNHLTSDSTPIQLITQRLRTPFQVSPPTTSTLATTLTTTMTTSITTTTGTPTPSNPTPTTISPTDRDSRKNGQPTARLKPGSNFLKIIPQSPSNLKSIIDSLTSYAQENSLPKQIVEMFVFKIQDYVGDFSDDDVSLAYAVCWLYTTNSWVYEQANLLLREDSPVMNKIAPFITCLMRSYNLLQNHMTKTGDSSLFYSGTVYRRTKLTPRSLEFYKKNSSFVWSSFTSTSVEIPSATFGPALFVITIPDPLKRFALNVEEVSAFPDEQEILLLPNVAFEVVKIMEESSGIPPEFANCKVVICINIVYACVAF